MAGRQAPGFVVAIDAYGSPDEFFRARTRTGRLVLFGRSMGRPKQTTPDILRQAGSTTSFCDWKGMSDLIQHAGFGAGFNKHVSRLLVQERIIAGGAAEIRGGMVFLTPYGRPTKEKMI
ncbi:hypothetical protein A6U86_19840 [Rhizobium sp. AC27/96]|nr:hypothetical protein A6U86_19840 [Rhizobium sp. AC27/96]